MTSWLFGAPGTPKAKYRQTEFLLVVLVVGFFIWGSRLPRIGPELTRIYQQLELLMDDMRFLARGSREAPATVAIVAVDEFSLKELGQWPFPRDYHAKLIRNLQRDGAKAVFFDVLFNEPDRSGQDAELVRAMKEAGNVFLPLTNFGPITRVEQMKKRLAPYTYDQSLAGRSRLTAELTFPLPELLTAAAGTGFVGTDADPDGKFRTVPAFWQVAGADVIVPHIGFEIARIVSAVKKSDIRNVGAEGVSFGETIVPLAGASRFSLNFYGGEGRIYTLPYADVYRGKFAKRAFDGRVVVIIHSAAGTTDLRPNPFDPLFPGGELNATFIANLLEASFVRHAPPRVGIAMIVAFGFIIWAFVARMSLLGGAAFVGALLLVYGSMAVGVFQEYSVFMPMTTPMLSAVVCYMGCTIYRALTEERQKKFYNETFRQYVPAEFVDLIADNPSLTDLGGDRKIITCLFSDIRGFTTWSEQGDPHEVVEQLNEYLTVMSDIVFAYKGTLDKFIGDAIMTFWNAPIEATDHAERGVRCAMAMQVGLAELHKVWEQEGKPLLNIGVGLNTGPAVVGNTGSPTRKNYTLLGDSVNLAARLEGVTKEFHLTVLVSENTYEVVKDQFIAREIDLLRVKGKLQPVTVYEIMADKNVGLTEPQQQVFNHYSAGLEAYRNRQWEEALGEFVRALMIDQHNPDGPSLTYRDRCREYQESPPPDDWDGVYVMTKK